MSLEKLRADFANLFVAVKEYNARMTTDHVTKKEADTPALSTSTFWFIDKDLLKSMLADSFKSFGTAESTTIDPALRDALALIQQDAATYSPKDLTSVFYATLKESAIPDTIPQELFMNFYMQPSGVVQHVGDEG